MKFKLRALFAPFLLLLVGSAKAASPDIKLQPQQTVRELGSSDVAVRRKAIQQFVDSLDTSEVKEYDDSLLPVIYKSIGDPDSEIRYYGFSAARMLAHAVVLSKQSKDGKIFGRKVTLDFSREPRLKAAVSAATSDPDARIRTCAVSILGKGYPASEENEQLLTKLAGAEKNPRVKREIVDGLAAGKYTSKAAEDSLIAMLDDKTEDVKGWAGYFLGQMKAKSAMPKLLSSLDDERPFVRERILQGIGAMGTNAKPHLPELRKRLKSEKNASIRREFDAALKSIESN